MSPYSLLISIEIRASAEKVWRAVTDPNNIKKYMFGTKASSEWREGAPIRFEGIYEDESYLDKGMIHIWDPPKIFQHTYLSQFSGLEDKPENYQVVTYTLHDRTTLIELELKQENIHSKEAMEHSRNGWGMILKKIAEIAEAL